MAQNKLTVIAVVVGGLAYAISGGEGTQNSTGAAPSVASVTAQPSAPIATPPVPVAAALAPPVALDPPSPARSGPVVPASPPRPAPSTTAPAASPTAFPEPIRRSLYVTGREVPLRARPSAEALVVDRLGGGLEVGEVARDAGWVKIRHPLTQAEGWVSARRVTAERPREEAMRRGSEPESGSSIGTGAALTTAAIVALIVERSVASYRATRPCACPYNKTASGRSCGGNSAYSKPRGAAPLCYASDVTPAMVSAYRERESRVAGRN
jgi:hypothetical protein